MTSMTRLLGLLLGGAIACAVTACTANDSVTVCGVTGVLCPAGTHCAAAQGICISDEASHCGDLHQDDDEKCDDGNNLDGDGCSKDCKSTEECGNGTLDKPFPSDPKNAKNEDCDTPLQIDTRSGLFCSSTCKFEQCGNGVTDSDIGEICDDGNTTGGDGCAADCKSTEVCGNHKLDQPFKDANGAPDLNDPRNEVCDDGNNKDNDGCASDCRSTEACGNGKIDPGEECDDGTDPDGNSRNGDDKDCRSDCIFNRCGDGHPNLNGLLHKEECDAGAPFNGGPAPAHNRSAIPREAAGCNIDCTAPTCGDGKVNHLFKPDGTHGEECDDGTGNKDSADCTANCLRNVCGDNLRNTDGPAHAEGCDDGNRNDNDACNNACILSTCGDGILDPRAQPDGPGEQCDLGDDNDDHGACLKNCLLAKCGDGKIETDVEECDNGADNGKEGNPCSSTCKKRQCGNGIIDPGEECDSGAANNDAGDCRTDCIINRCGDGFVNDTIGEDGKHKEQCEGAARVDHGSHIVAPVETADCNINCTTPACGDSILNRHFHPPKNDGSGQSTFPEQCDDGGRDNDNNCSADCLFERCGNGIVDFPEQCDGTPGCSPTCFRMECGNRIVDPGEECDNGEGNNDNADCRSDCVINRCGDGHINSMGAHHEACDGGPVAGPHDRTAVPTNTNDCNLDCKAATCGDGTVNPIHKVTDKIPNTLLTEQCDPPSEEDGCSATCQIESCGNGVTDPNEQCDDGNRIDGDGCEANCTLPRCGNGITDHDLAHPENDEECDDGNAINTDACTNACKHAVCNDGFVHEGVETCDDPTHVTTCPYQRDLQECKVCDPVDCVKVNGQQPYCGDGHVDDVFEICDSSNRTCGSCIGSCTIRASQASTGLIFAAAANDYRVPDPESAPEVDTFTLSDGFATRTFELVIADDPIDENDVLVPIAEGENNSQVAARIVLAINTGSGLQIHADSVGGVVTLVNKAITSRGDVPIVNNVLTTNFAKTGMDGSKGGDCPGGETCTADIDCKSTHCTIVTGFIGTCDPEPDPEPDGLRTGGIASRRAGR